MKYNDTAFKLHIGFIISICHTQINKESSICSMGKKACGTMQPYSDSESKRLGSQGIIWKYGYLGPSCDSNY